MAGIHYDGPERKPGGSVAMPLGVERRFRRRSSEDVPVLLADDHAATRAGVRLTLERRGFVIVAEADNADDAVAAALLHRPALCLLDVYMPGNGISAAQRIHDALPETKIVVLTVSADENDLLEALAAGASGYLLKDTPASRLPAALHGVLAGEAALPRKLERWLIDQFREPSRRFERRGVLPRRARRPAKLTTREWEVLELLADHLPTAAVAHRLGISEITVRRHISSAVRKLDVPNRTSAVELVSGDWLEGPLG
jgi:two-component system nitrate/nitrite response regulator NarL